MNFMKKIYCLLFVLILAGCSKNGDVNPNDLKVTYNLSANAIGEFSINYTDPTNNSNQGVSLTGKSWSKSYTVSNVKSYPNGSVFNFNLSAISYTAGENYTLSITANNHVVVTSTYSAVYNEGAIGYKYVVSH